jgi:hypothetical protein
VLPVGGRVTISLDDTKVVERAIELFCLSSERALGVQRWRAGARSES